MRCISCGLDIPPQFFKAIENNICPGCGGEILAAEQKSLLDELEAAISKMPGDPRALANWIVSNYKMKKIGDAEPIQKVPAKNSSEEFAKRSGVNRVSETIAKNKKAKIYEEALDDSGGDEREEEPDNEDLKVLKMMQSKYGINPFEDNGAPPERFTVNEEELDSDTGYKTELEKKLESTPEGKKFLRDQRMKKIMSQQGEGVTINFGRAR